MSEDSNGQFGELLHEDRLFPPSEQFRKTAHVNNETPYLEGSDHWYHRLMQDADRHCEPEPMDSEDLLFILYTSGTTGQPKGIMHTTGGYLTQAHATSRWVFDLKEDVVQKIGAIARPQEILFSSDLPKTRSGKIMRRLLRDIAAGKVLGNTTTLADPAVVEQLKKQYEETEG